jgi:hypothetical protein
MKGNGNAIKEMAGELIEQKRVNRAMQEEMERLRVQFDELQMQHS